MTRKQKRIVAFTIGAIGAWGQAVLLRHELADCLPYKMMANPSAEFYAGIGWLGFVTSPIVAMVAIWRLSKFQVSYVPAVACVVCPTVFLFLFMAGRLIGNVDMANIQNFDRTRPGAVFLEFVKSASRLLTSGVFIGAICGWGVALWNEPRAKANS